LFFELAAAAAIAALVSLVACRVVMKMGPVDAPDAARKAHDTPTPTSGGVGMAVGFGASLVLFALFSETMRTDVSPRGALLLTIAASFSYVFLAIGFWDDARDLTAKLKLVLFTAASFAATFAVGPVTVFAVSQDFVVTLPYWIAVLGTALWVFTVVNGVNFMDGANGLAMGSVAIGLLALGAIAFVHGSMAGVIICLCSVGAIAGFLFWNFPSGRLFAGDSGALFAGALAALASVIVIHRAEISPLIPPILFFPLLADVLVTLAWRAWRRRSLFDGHSEHLYQIARHAGMSHAEVSFIYWSATGACGVVGFLVANEDGYVPLLALATMAGAAVVISTAVRRFAGRRGIEGV
jgi:UDP-N-acetylmuramyl pentapeptide phosphotransferase/UDP-N-acetylglucosamine-1-phosphate transferase